MVFFLAADVKEIRYIYIWSAIMIAMLLVAFAGYSYFKKWMSDGGISSVNASFTLSDLRRLHESGQMSDAEYELTRTNMLASARKMTGQLPDVLPGRPVKPVTPEEPQSATGL